MCLTAAVLAFTPVPPGLAGMRPCPAIPTRTLRSGVKDPCTRQAQRTASSHQLHLHSGTFSPFMPPHRGPHRSAAHDFSTPVSAMDWEKVCGTTHAWHGKAWEERRQQHLPARSKYRRCPTFPCFSLSACNQLESPALLHTAKTCDDIPTDPQAYETP